MTLWTGHELATAVATLAALLSVLLGEQMNPVAWGALAFVPLGAWLKHTGRGLSTTAGGALALGSVLFGVAFTVAEGLPSVLLGAGYALMLLVGVRLVNRETPAHDLQLYALSLLLVLDAAALNITWLYAPCFLAYTVAIVWGLTTRELKRAAQDEHTARHAAGEPPLWRESGLLRGRFFAATAVISVVVLMATLSLFVLFPRVGLGILRLSTGGRTSGFANSVRLGESGSITQDTTVIMRVERVDGREEMPLRLYFRGAAFDQYDGTTWIRSDAAKNTSLGQAARMPRPGDETVRYRVGLEPMGVPYLFAAGKVARVSVLPGSRILGTPPVPARDGMGDLVLPAPPVELLSYEVEADLEPVDFGALDDSGEIPEGLAPYLDHSVLPERIRALAREWTTGQPRPLQKVAALAARLGEFQYELEDEPPPDGISPLEHFLFNRHAGHCEYYAAALAMLARAVGVPARMVGGYQGGALHPDGYLVLRQSDAHAWTEVWVSGTGWVAVDATPAGVLTRPPLSAWANLAERLQRAWEEYVVDFSLNTQISGAQGLVAFLNRLRNWRPQMDAQDAMTGARTAGGIVVVLAAGMLALRQARRRVRRQTRGERLRVALERATVRVAGSAPPTHTVREWLAGVAVLVSDEDRALLGEAARRYEQCRFGGELLLPREERDWSRRVDAVRSNVLGNPGR